VLVFGALLAAGLACGSFPSPAEPTTVGSVIPGTRALTDDQAYYESPAWSPNGRYLGAFRGYRITADIIHADSFETGPVLIDLDSGERRFIGSPPTVKPEDAFGPVLWQPGEGGVTFYYFDRAGGQEGPALVTYFPDTAEFSSLAFCQCGRVAFNAEGNQILVVGPSEEAFELSWFDLETGLTSNELSLDRAEPRQHRYFYLALSPDNGSLLLDDLDGTVFKYEMDSGQAPVPFLSPAATPAWSPDGSKIVYASLPANGDLYSGQLMIANADGSSPEPLFPEPQPAGMLAPAWSPDGTQIAFLYGTRHSNRILIAEVPERLRPLGVGATPAGP